MRIALLIASLTLTGCTVTYHSDQVTGRTLHGRLFLSEEIHVEYGTTTTLAVQSTPDATAIKAFSDGFVQGVAHAASK